MGRTVFADERIQEYIDKLYGLDQWSIGFIIGQQTAAQKDYVVHMIRTPLIEDEEPKKAKGKAAKGPPTLATCDDIWLTSHAKQAERMMSGGLDIIGIFVCAPPDMMKAGQMKLKQLLFAVQKVVNRTNIFMQADGEVVDRIVLQICPATRKLTCRTFDISDSKCGAKPAEWKMQSFLNRWIELDARMSVDLAFPVPVSLMDSAISKQILNGVAPLCRSIQQAVCTIDDKLMGDTTTLDSAAAGQQHSHQSGGKKGKKQHKDTSSAPDKPLKYTLQLFTEPVSNCNNNSGEPEVTKCGARMLLRGTICGRAFVHNRANVKEATQALKADLTHSLLSRCELLCEDLLQAEEEQDPKVLYEMPLRVFTKIGDGPVCLCDYLFHDETASDSVERFREIADLVIAEEELCMDLERLPSDEELLEPTKANPHAGGMKHSKKSGKLSTTDVIGMVAGAAMAVVAAGISFMYLGQE